MQQEQLCIHFLQQLTTPKRTGQETTGISFGLYFSRDKYLMSIFNFLDYKCYFFWAFFSFLLGCTNIWGFELLLCSFYVYLSQSKAPEHSLSVLPIFRLLMFLWNWRALSENGKLFCKTCQAYCFLKCNTLFAIMTTYLIPMVATFLLSNEGFLSAKLKYKFDQRLQEHQADLLR